MTDYQRARSPEQKAERMTAIMDVTEGLFRELPYHEINMGLIAKELGWSRSNLYKYASTQEEIFLQLHSRANRAFVDELVIGLSNAPVDNGQFASIWATVTERHIDFLRYQDILIEIIESNTSFDKLVEFKRSFSNMLKPLIDIFRRQTGLEATDSLNMYLRLVFQAPGLYNHFHCTEKITEAMRLAEIPPVTGNFKDAYTGFVKMCLDAGKL